MTIVAITGTRGVPASWGGVERQCEELYSRLASADFKITIYARKSYVKRPITFYRGIHILRFPTIQTKYTEAFFHTLISIIHILISNPQIVHIYSQGPSLFTPLIKLLRPKIKIFFTCGGLDWQRKKWPFWASYIIRLGEIFSARFTDFRIVVSQELQYYYKEQYGVNSFYIPNGISTPVVREANLIKKFGLINKNYFLFVGRLVPEKRIEDIIKAFFISRSSLKLVIVGDSAGTNNYVQMLKSLAEHQPSVIFLGYQYGEMLQELYSNAIAFINASEVEGLPLTVLEAFSYGLSCLLSDIPPHREILKLAGSAGRSFPLGKADALSYLFGIIEKVPPDEFEKMSLPGQSIIQKHYNWDRAANELARLYRTCTETP